MLSNIIFIHKLLKIFLVFFVLSGAVVAQDRTWERFSPPNGDWSIISPGVMKPDAEALNPSSSKGSYSYSDYNGFFAVVYRDIPRRYVPWGPSYSNYYKKVRKDAVKAAKGELIKDEEFTKGIFKGREVHIRITNNTSAGRETSVKKTYRIERFRMFFHEKRFYLILAVLPESEIYSPTVEAYLNSFTVK